MSFSDKAKLTALAIVHVFETSKPFGDYSAVAVLNDGAGVSYGVSQFTHRAGSLLKVVNTYIGMGGTVGLAVLKDRLHILMDGRPGAIQQLANDRHFKDALRFAGETEEMRVAQNQIAENFYLLPSIEACEGSGFVLPMSLAVIYDSINHGSFAAIRNQVQRSDSDEKAWITEYVRRRHEWLRSKPKLKVTSYRTRFFLDEITDGNWQLDLPIYPHGTEINDEMIVADEDSAVEPVNTYPASEGPAEAEVLPRDAASDNPSDPTVPAQPPTQNAENITNVTTGNNVPENFVAENKSVDAPEKEGSTAKAATMTVGGFAVPAFLVGIITAIKSAIESGFISAAQIGDALLSFLTNNTKYVFAGIGLVIGGMFLKKLYRQVTLWLSMYFAARADMHNVTVKPK